jgi:hypothetical protein
MPTETTRTKLYSFAFAAVALALSCVPEAKEPVYKGQSYPQAIATMCNADELAGVAAEGDPLERSRKRGDFLKERVENPDAVYLYTILRVEDPTAQAVTLRREACNTGLERCALADTLDKE